MRVSAIVLGRIAVVAVGAYLGVYAGNSVFRNASPGIRTLSAEQRIPYPLDIRLTLDVGDYINSSRVAVYDIRGDALELDTLKKKLILVFLSPSCDECPLFLRKWKREITPYVREDVRVLYAIPRGVTTLEHLDLSDISNDIVYFDQQRLAREINLVAFPAIVCITKEHQVYDIQYGGAEFYHTEMVEEFTTR